jgi:hypothetical protein
MTFFGFTRRLTKFLIIYTQFIYVPRRKKISKGKVVTCALTMYSLNPRNEWDAVDGRTHLRSYNLPLHCIVCSRSTLATSQNFKYCFEQKK